RLVHRVGLAVLGGGAEPSAGVAGPPAFLRLALLVHLLEEKTVAGTRVPFRERFLPPFLARCRWRAFRTRRRRRRTGCRGVPIRFWRTPRRRKCRRMPRSM